MAEKTMTPINTPYNEITKITLEAATSVSDGMRCKLPNSDEYVVIIVENEGTAEGTIKVKAPTSGGYAVATSDLSLSLASKEKAVIRVESAKFANNLGEILLIPSATTVKACVIY